MLRTLTPELLDELPPKDPRAIHSRGDLRRVQRLMGTAGVISRGLRDRPFCTLVELGSGDGTLLLNAARSIPPNPTPVHAILVDRQALVTAHTRAAFEELSWTIETVQADVFDYLKRRSSEIADVTIANLFLHHFLDHELVTLLRDVSRQTSMFFACEPLRSRIALAAASMLPFIGCNSVTVHDAKTSVRAGFHDRELSTLWPQNARWRLNEYRAGRFIHAFTACRASRARGAESSNAP